MTHHAQEKSRILHRTMVGTIVVAILRSRGGYYITTEDVREHRFMAMRFISTKMEDAEESFHRVVEATKREAGAA